MAKITIKVSCDSGQNCDDDTSDVDAAQEARETAAAHVKQSTAPGDRHLVGVPEHLQSWKNYGAHAWKQVKEQAQDLLKHPENIVGSGELGAPLGIFAGPLAKTADRGALSRAQVMASEGAHPQDIWDKTGWFQGTDKGWRFEIPDANAKWLRDPTRSRPDKLSDVLSHPELYKAYPELADVWAEPIRKGSANYGEYQPPGGGWSEGIRVQRGLDDPRSTALHEAQHAIQQREGFEPGGAPGQTPAEAQKRDIYWQAAMVAHRMQNRGMSVDEAVHDVFSPPDLTAGFSTPAASLDTIKALAERHPWEDLSQMSSFYTPRGVYRRIAGEVESRSVEARKDMTPEQRRAEPPWVTQQRDVPLARQTLRQRLGWPTPP